MKKRIYCLPVIITLLLLTFTYIPAKAAEFLYEDGPTGGLMNTILYYEVGKDYTIDLYEYFKNIEKLPGKYGKWKKTEAQHQAILDYIAQLPTCQWDFIELEAGTLTVKKGYRWDGASTPWNNLDIANNREFYLRPSCIHDAMYDLMRMGYLLHDKVGYDFGDPGFMNRLIADCLLYMIVIEEGRDSWFAQNVDFEFVRLGGAGKTHKDKLLAPWKYHISRLTAYAGDGYVDLHFLPADHARKDPNNYESDEHAYIIYRCEKTAASPWLPFQCEEIAVIRDFDVSSVSSNYYSADWDVYYTDATVSNGKEYTYYVESSVDEEELNWKDRHHDHSNTESVVPIKAPGNALVLDGIDDFVEAGTVSNNFSCESPFEPITFEAWVYPAPQSGKSAILAFNTSSGEALNRLMYDGDTQTFCYYDDTTDYIHSADQFVPGNWYHVAVTIDESNQGVLFINGEEQAVFVSGTRPFKTSLLNIGMTWAPSNFILPIPVPSHHFKGKIDEARVWNVSLTSADIQNGMCGQMRGDENGLIALWHFDKPEHSRLASDATANGNDGTLYSYDTTDTAFHPSEAMTGTNHADAGPDQTVDEGSPAIFDGLNSTSICSNIVSYAWDFGDGSPVVESQTPTHVFEDDGIYTVTLTVTGDNGSKSTDTATVEVLNVAPVVWGEANKTMADPCEAIGFAGNFSDPGTADTHTYAWDFGDGSPFVTGTLTPTYAYEEAGTYSVTLTVTDDDGGVGNFSFKMKVRSKKEVLRDIISHIKNIQITRKTKSHIMIAKKDLRKAIRELNKLEETKGALKQKSMRGINKFLLKIDLAIKHLEKAQRKGANARQCIDRLCSFADCMRDSAIQIPGSRRK